MFLHGKTTCINNLTIIKQHLYMMIANSNIDFLTLKNTSVAHTIPRRFLVWLYMAVLAQPLLHSLVFWLISSQTAEINAEAEAQAIKHAIMGFMFGVLMIIIWMSYDSGFIRELNQYIHRCKTYKNCHRKIHNVYNHIDSCMHLFWVFIAPPLSFIITSLYAITLLLPSINFIPH